MGDWRSFPFEMKLAGDEMPAGSISGYGSAFGNVDGGGDVIMSGAFRKSLRAHKAAGTAPMMLYRHALTMGDLMPIGVWSEMAEDDKGLKVAGQIAIDSTLGRDVHALCKIGAVRGMSIGYRAKDFVLGTKPEEPRRKIRELDLIEVSLCPDPMNMKATIDQVKAAHKVKTIREFEDFLRDVGGFSNAAAKAIAASGFKAHDPEPRDEDGAGEYLAKRLARVADFLRQP